MFGKPSTATSSSLRPKATPEAIADLCKVQSGRRATMLRQVDGMATRGMRVLGVANALFNGREKPASIRDVDYQFLGLVGLADPMRDGVLQSVRECHDAGIDVAMITGDYPTTAMAIARQAGIQLDGGIVTGEDLSRMGENELRSLVNSARVFARTKPEHKLRLVNAFKANGEIVAMTGDGVNDAPSLKAAHIGIAMGGRGTDVAREAAAIVLLDDDFGSIVKAVRLGRRIYDNLRKAMGYLLAVHVPIAGLSLLPIICGWPLVFTPVHIAFLELIIDPVASIVFEAETEERDLMRRAPRKPETPMFTSAMMGWSIFQDAWVLLFTASVFRLALVHGKPRQRHERSPLHRW
jgi:P-type Ca2+ transporter type 2C